MNKRKKKIRKVILYMILLLIIIILIILLMTNINKKRKYDEEKYKAKLEYNEEYYQEKVFPSGVYQLSVLYKQEGGKLDLNIYYKKLYRYTKYLSELYNENIIDKNENEIKQYFELNSEIIKNDIGIKDFESFVDTINILKQYKKLGEYKRSSINIETISSDQNYCIFDTIINYTESEEELIVKTFISKNNTNIDVYFNLEESTNN